MQVLSGSETVSAHHVLWWGLCVLQHGVLHPQMLPRHTPSRDRGNRGATCTCQSLHLIRAGGSHSLVCSACTSFQLGRQGCTAWSALPAARPAGGGGSTHSLVCSACSSSQLGGGGSTHSLVCSACSLCQLLVGVCVRGLLPVLCKACPPKGADISQHWGMDSLGQVVGDAVVELCHCPLSLNPPCASVFSQTRSVPNQENPPPTPPPQPPFGKVPDPTCG